MTRKVDILYSLSIGACLFFTACSYDEQLPVVGQKLSGGYTVNNGQGVVYLMADNIFKPEIYGNVIRCAFNKDYILAMQVPDKSHYRIMLGFNYDCYAGIISDGLEKSPSEKKFYKTFFIGEEELLKSIVSKKKFSHQVADSLIDNDPFYKSVFSNKLNYWIISHTGLDTSEYMPMSKVYGPFNKDQYNLKRSELHIPLDLQLKE